MEKYVFSKKKDAELTKLGFALGTLCTRSYTRGGVDESEDGRRASAWSESGTFSYEGARTDTTAIVRVGKDVHAFNAWDPTLDLGISDLETAIEELELLESDETAAAAVWFTALFDNWYWRIRLSDTVEISAPELTEAGNSVSCDAAAILAMHVYVYDQNNVQFGEVVPQKTLALDVYRLFNGEIDPAQVNSETRAVYEAEKAAEQAKREAQAAWEKDVKAAAARIVKMFKEMEQNGQLEVTFWDEDSSRTDSRVYKWLEVRESGFGASKSIYIQDDWRRELTASELNAIVAMYYGVEITTSTMGQAPNRHFVGNGWDLTGKFQIENREFFAAAKIVGYGDTFDWTKPARLRQTRKGDDFLVNDDNGVYFRFICGKSTDVDGEIVWQAENSYGDIYMIVATAPSPDVVGGNDNSTSIYNNTNSVAPEVSSDGGEVLSAVDAMKGEDNMVDMTLRLEPSVNLTLGGTEALTIGGADFHMSEKTSTVFINTDNSTTVVDDAADQKVKQRLNFLASEARFVLSAAIRYYTCEEIRKWWAALIDDVTTTEMILTELKARRDALLQEEGNRNVRALAAFVNAFLSNPQEWQRDFLIQQVSVRIGKDNPVVAELSECADKYMAYMSAVMDNNAPLALPAPSVETATIAAMNKVVSAVIELGPVVSYPYTQVVPDPAISNTVQMTSDMTPRTFSVANLTGEGSEFVINTIPFAGQKDNIPSIVYNAAEEQPGDFSEGEVFSSQFNVVTATVLFDIQRFGTSTPKKGDRNMKKTKTNKIKAKGGHKILSPFAVYANQIAAAGEKAREDAKDFNVQTGLEDLATGLDNKVSTYATSLPEDVAKQYMVERYVFVLATEIMRKYRESVAGPQVVTDAQVISNVDQIVEMAHLIAKREGSQMNIWQLSFGNIEGSGAQYSAQIAHVAYNRIVKAAELGMSGIKLGTTRVKVGDLTDVVDRFCPDLVELNFLGNLEEVVGLSKGLYQAEEELSADILVAFRHGLPSLFVEDLKTGEYHGYVHPGLYTADIKTTKFLRAFIAKRDKVAATLEKLPEYEEAETKKAGANPEAVRQKYAYQKAEYETKLASYNDQIDHLTDQVRTSQNIPTTLNGIMKWAAEVRRVEKDFWLSSAGMLKQNVYLVPTRRINVPDNRNFGDFYDYATTGTYRHICKMTEGQELSPKQFSQYSNRFSNTMAPGRLFDETVPDVIAITPCKLGVTTNGQFLLNGRFVQSAFNTIPGYYFTLAAVCTLAIQCRPGTVSIKGVGDTVYPDVMRARVAAEIRKLNALPHHPDQKPDKAGNYIVRIVAGELTEQEEKDLFEFRENQKDARWQNCLVLRYTNREARDRDLENGNVPIVAVFVDFNSFKCTAEAKPVLDKEGNQHTCDTGLHVLSIAHKSTASNMSSQLLTGWLAASPKETMAKVHGAVNPVIERQWAQQRDLIPGFVSATEMRPRTIFTAEGESETMIPDYNRLSGVAAPIFGRIYAPDGQAEVSKAVRSMSRRFGEFKIPMRISSYLTACDPVLLFGGTPVLRAQNGYCEILTAEKNSGTGRLHRYPKTRIDDALRVKNIGIGAYLYRLLKSDNSAEVKAMTTLFVVDLCPGVCCLPDVPDLLTTIGGADTDGDHCSIVWESPRNEPGLTHGIPHGLCVEKPKNSDADPYDAAFDAYEKAYAATDTNGSEIVRSVVEAGKRTRDAWDKVKDDKSAIKARDEVAEIVRATRTVFETVKAQGFDEKTYLNPDPDNARTKAYNVALSVFKAVTAAYENVPYVKAKRDLVTVTEAWHKTTHAVAHKNAIETYTAVLEG